MKVRLTDNTDNKENKCNKCIDVQSFATDSLNCIL